MYAEGGNFVVLSLRMVRPDGVGPVVAGAGGAVDAVGGAGVAGVVWLAGAPCGAPFVVMGGGRGACAFVLRLSLRFAAEACWSLPRVGKGASARGAAVARGGIGVVRIRELCENLTRPRPRCWTRQ